MAEIYYLVSSFPEIDWDSDIPFTAAGFLAENGSALAPFQENINDIILVNDLYNLESFLKGRIAEYITGASRSKDAMEAAFRRPCLLDKESMLELVESPEDSPDFIIDYLEEFQDPGDRHRNIESLFIAYFEYLKGSKSLFLRDYADFEKKYRTIIAALRMRRLGIELDEKLPGDDELKKTILANLTVPDFGVKTFFPEIEYLLELFEKDTFTRGKGIDKVRYDYLNQISFENPFVEDTIYAYLLRLMVLERWQKLDEERGKEIILSIVTGETGK